MNISDLLAETDARRRRDAERYKRVDDDLCVVCHAYGTDKRTFMLRCFYEIGEVIPEAISLAKVEDVSADLRSFYYLRVCKSCRGAMLMALKGACDTRRALRGTPMDHDGGELFDEDTEACIQVRIAGATVMMTRERYDEWRQKNGGAA